MPTKTELKAALSAACSRLDCSTCDMKKQCDRLTAKDGMTCNDVMLFKARRDILQSKLMRMSREKLDAWRIQQGFASFNLFKGRWIDNLLKEWEEREIDGTVS